MSSYLAEYPMVSKRVYSVRVSWRRSSADSQREENVYTINMADREGVSDLGGDPTVKLPTTWKKCKRTCDLLPREASA